MACSGLVTDALPDAAHCYGARGQHTFQHRQASDRCCRMVRALFCFTPSGIMSTMSCRWTVWSHTDKTG